MKLILTGWGLTGLLVHAKHYANYQLDFGLMGALIELWHPDTHTFIFSLFECRILLEEVEIFLGLPRSRKGEATDMFIPSGFVSCLEFLQYFVKAEQASSLIVGKQINLSKLAVLSISALSSHGLDETQLLNGSKGFSTCLATVFLFHMEDGFLEQG